MTIVGVIERVWRNTTCAWANALVAGRPAVRPLPEYQPEDACDHQGARDDRENGVVHLVVCGRRAVAAAAYCQFAKPPSIAPVANAVRVQTSMPHAMRIFVSPMICRG